MKNGKIFEIKSSSSTHESGAGVTIHLGSMVNLGARKFARKREGSTDSLRRSGGCMTPKSKTGANFEKQEIPTQKNSTSGMDINRILKGNNYIKFFESPASSKKMNQSFDPQAIKTLQFNNQELGTPTKKKTQSFNKAEKTSKQFEKAVQNCKMPSSSFNLKASRHERHPTMYNMTTYNQPQTQREAYGSSQKGDFSFSDIKILESQIMILEDENNRMKKQIMSLTSQKEQQRKLRFQLQVQLKDLEKKVKEVKESDENLIQFVQKQVNELHMEVYQNLKAYKKQIKLQQNLNQIKLNKKEQNSQDTFQIYLKQTFHSHFKIIRQNLNHFWKQFSEIQLTLQKSEIRKNVLMRGSIELASSKNENRLLAERLKNERSRSKKYKDECQKLSKQNQLIRKSTLSKTQKKTNNSSNKDRYSNKKNDDNSILCLSDFSDD